MSPTPATSPSEPKALQLEGSRTGVLLFHGLSSSPLELQFIARGLHRAGYTVSVPVIPGYTFGLGQGPDRDVDRWMAAALDAFDALAQRCERVVVGGLCVGASIALKLASLRSDRVSAILALSTAMQLDGWGNPWYTPLLPLARVVPFAGHIRVPERLPFGLKDERMRAWVAKQMQASGRSEAGAACLRVDDLLRSRKLASMARRALPRLAMPLLLVHARDDECATPRSAFTIAAAVRTTQVRCVLLSDSYHMVSIDREKELVLSEMVHFLQQHLPASSAPGLTAKAQVVPLFASHSQGIAP